MTSQRILISGSIAYDTIMVFDGLFKDHILADRTHMLNVAFLTPRLRREFGGTAANIAFNLARLGGQAVVLGTVGHDGAEYMARMNGFGIDTRAVKTLSDAFTAQAFITTDLADNQITAFHPGAMMQAHQVNVGDADPGAWGIVAPNGKDAMIAHASQFKAAGIPFIFDPGQGLPMFSGEELRALLAQADALTVNDYESKMIADKIGATEAEIAAMVEHAIITRGADGSTLYERGVPHNIAAAPISKAIDPTGCGDAFRAGLLFGLARRLDWVTSARLGSVLGAIKIESAGAQNHELSIDGAVSRFEKAYARKPW